MVTSIRAVYEHGQLRLLDPVELADGEQVSITILREAGSRPGGRLSARDLLRLPLEERRRIMAAAAARAKEDYRSDSSLTDFEAYGDHDLYDETP